MNTFPIGIIDSGLGGLTIWREIVTLLRHESTVYLADHQHLPYSNKKTYDIRNYVTKLIKLLIHMKVKIIVIACNTATVAGIDWYRKKFPTIPIVGVVPVVKTASNISKTRRFAVLSTFFTAKSGYQKKLIQTFAADCDVYSIGIGDLVTTIEEGDIDSPKISRLLKNKLLPILKRNIDVIALGCTHFPLVASCIRDIVGEDIAIVDSGSAVARQIVRILQNRSEFSESKKVTHDFFTTGNATKISRVVAKLIQKQIYFTHVNI
ncbi:glutamate racemase [Candidatus Gottesmanbacteria bacterium]|nr:glutamate racemase [Candidatus Gottesmanbacteria bacterium]